MARRFVKTVVSAVLFAAAPLMSAAADVPEKVLLQSAVDSGDAAHVDVVVEAAGDLKFRQKDDVRTLKTSVVARLAYEEKLLRLAEPRRSVRSYCTAEAKLQVDKTSQQPRLRDDRNIVVSESSEDRPLLFSPLGPLSTEELELLQIPCNSLLLESLLPDRSATVGDQWPHDGDLMCALLNLDAVSQSTVVSTLTAIDDEAARIELQGTVQGALGGVATEFDVAGRYKFDLRACRVTWLAALLTERRSIGHIEPGVDAVTRLQMVVTPQTVPEALSNKELEGLELSARPEMLDLSYESTAGKFSLAHDRRWHVMTEGSELLSLRLVDRGELVAQCNVTKVDRPDPAERPTLAQFQADIRRSLDAHFTQFTRVGESANSLGQTIFRAEAVGTVQDLEINWIYYLVFDDAGRQLVFTFTCEQPMVERFADADRRLVSTLRFVEPPAATAGRPTPAPPRR